MKNLFFAAFIVLSVFNACSGDKKYEIVNEDKYNKSQASIEEIEKKAPARFIEVNVNSKKNLLKQTVIKGRINNKAKIVSFKDVNIKLRFYSKTGALLEEDVDTIYETIAPGGSANFKSKYFTPKGTDSVSVTVIDAKY